MSNTHLGHKLGPRIAQIVSDAHTHHLRQTMDLRRRLSVMAAVDFFRTITHEARGTVTPITRTIAEHPELDPALRSIFDFLTDGDGEMHALMNLGIYGSGLSGGIGEILTNMLAPFIQSEFAKHPNALIPVSGAADLAARGIITYEHGNSEAHKAAINAERFNSIFEGSKTFPDPTMIFELMNRGVMEDVEGKLLLHRNGYEPNIHEQLLALRRTHIPPADAADMVVRGILSEDDGAKIAARSGWTADDFRRLVLDTGEPPGTQDLLFAYRRGIIDRDRLDKGIRQSRTRNEWIPVIESLRHIPMSTADAVQAVVQNHIDSGEGRRVAEENGLDPKYWDTLVQTAGEPASRTEMVELWRRSLVTQAQVEQAIRESRVKNKYIGDIIKLKRRLPPERTIVSMVRHGVISHEDGIRRLIEHGFDHGDAAALVKEGSVSATSRQRDLTLGQITSLYEEKAISASDALANIHHLGYTQHEADLIIKVADLKRAGRFRAAALGHVRSLYISHKITEQEAITFLDSEGFNHEERDQYIRLWTYERKLNVPTLTEAQIVSALRRNALDRPQAVRRLQQKGYSDEDIRILVGPAR